MQFPRYLSVRVAVALGAGLILPCAFAPYGIWFLACLSPAALMLVLEGRQARSAAVLGFCFGLGMFAHGVWWVQVSVHQFGVPYYSFSVSVTALFIVVLALYPALFAYLLAKLRQANAPLLLTGPSLWVLVEYLRGWLFTGFPWLALGYSQIDSALAGYAPVFGVFGCSALVAMQSAMLVEIVRRPRVITRIILVAAIVAMSSIGLWLGQQDFTRVVEADLRVALIQGAIPQGLKWRPDMRLAAIERYRQLSLRHPQADVVIWPETAIAAFPHEVEDVLAALDREARASGTDLLIGMPTGEPWKSDYFNSVVNFGGVAGTYNKRHLVPFGEFFPFKDLVMGLAMLLHIPMSDFSSGADDQANLTIAGHAAGISICYEDAFGTLVSSALPDAKFLVNVSNDAWFGDTIAPHQHLQIARMRALETQRYLLRGTNTGITAIIDHRGHVVARAPQFVESTLAGKFDARAGATPYVRFGDLPLLGAALLALLASVLLGRRRWQGDQETTPE